MWMAIPIILVVVLLRVRRMSQHRPLRVEWLWIIPVLLLVVAGLVMAQSPLAGLDWLWLAPPSSPEQASVSGADGSPW